MSMKIVERIDQMRQEDRERAAEWFRQRAQELMAMDYYPEIIPCVDRMMEIADELSSAPSFRA